MKTRITAARCVLAAALLAGPLVVACKVEDGPPRLPDTAIGRPPVVATPPISDKSLRPPPESNEPATLIRGAPSAVIEALRLDTATTITQIDSAPAARPTDSDIDMLRGEITIPVAGVRASSLYDTYGELRGGTRQHEALDILAARGTPVLSAASGKVLKLFDSRAGGLMVYAADTSERFILMYAHLDAYAPGLAEGQPLARGQQIGVVGTSGNAPPGTPHLHFSIARSSDVSKWWKGSPVNPYSILKP